MFIGFRQITLGAGSKSIIALPGKVISPSLRTKPSIDNNSLTRSVVVVKIQNIINYITILGIRDYYLTKKMIFDQIRFQITGGNQRHIALNDRIYLEKCLDEKMAFKDTAKFLCKDPSTLSKEVKRHRKHKPGSSFNNSQNTCVHKQNYNLKNVCSRPSCNGRCASCPLGVHA